MASTKEDLLELLLDAWVQFGIEGTRSGQPTRWAGGLSTLEDIEIELRAAGKIDQNGLAAYELAYRAPDSVTPIEFEMSAEDLAFLDQRKA